MCCLNVVVCCVLWFAAQYGTSNTASHFLIFSCEGAALQFEMKNLKDISSQAAQIACVQVHELSSSSMSLHALSWDCMHFHNPWSCMHFHEFACSSMSLHVFPKAFFVGAAHNIYIFIYTLFRYYPFNNEHQIFQI